MSAYSLTDARDAFLQWIAQHRRPRTAENYTRYLDRFIKSVGNVKLHQLAPLHLMRWGRTWHQIQAVQRWINWAVKKAKIMEENPFVGVERPRLGIRKRVLNEGEKVSLMRRSLPSYRRFLVALRETMARPQEMREVTWEEITWEEKPRGLEAALRGGRAYFVLEEYKARDRRLDPDAPRVIPISPRLGRLLSRLRTRRRVTEGCIFRNCKEEEWTPNALRCRMRRLRKRVGIARDRRGETVVAYTFRHTMATLATKAGVRDRTLADLLGHTSTRTTARYQHLDVQHLVDAMALIRARNKPRQK